MVAVLIMLPGGAVCINIVMQSADWEVGQRLIESLGRQEIKLVHSYKPSTIISLHSVIKSPSAIHKILIQILSAILTHLKRDEQGDKSQ